MNNIRLKVQLPLDEFIGTNHEEQVIIKLYDINKLLNQPLTINFWYDKSKKLVTSPIIKHFISQWDSKLPYKTNIAPSIFGTAHDFIWFNIIHRSDYNKTIWTRFDYVYETHTPQNILNGLTAFKNTALFCLKPKPMKYRSKRSD